MAVLQNAPALVRVAAECAEDLAADGVVYAEVRFAPELHVEQGLSLEEVVEAVLEGFRVGTRRAAETGRRIRVGCLLTAMRHAARSREIAELAVRYRDLGVVGFDIAGAEAGFPPTRHLDAFEYLRQQNAHFTIHAGEAFGLPSIWEALQWCGADRLGHGVRIVDDITLGADGTPRLGLLAAYVRDKRIPLEMCPTSNVHTGAAKSLADHPIGLLAELRFRVTVNTDNRLMSDVSMSSELTALAGTFDYGWADLQWFAVNAMKSAFLGFDERLTLINEVIKPGYAALTGLISTRPRCQFVVQPGGERVDQLAEPRALGVERRARGQPGRVRLDDERDQPAQRLRLGQRLARGVVAGPVAHVQQQFDGQLQLGRVDEQGALGDVVGQPGQGVGVQVVDLHGQLAHPGLLDDLRPGRRGGQVVPVGAVLGDPAGQRALGAEHLDPCRREPRNTGASSR